MQKTNLKCLHNPYPKKSSLKYTMHNIMTCICVFEFVIFVSNFFCIVAENLCDTSELRWFKFNGTYLCNTLRVVQYEMLTVRLGDDTK